MVGPRELLERLEEPREVLPLLDRSAEEHVRAFETVAANGRLGLIAPEGTCAHAPRHQPQALRLDARGTTRVDRGSRGTHHESGVTSRELESPFQHGGGMPRVVVRMTQEPQIVHGRDQRGPRWRHHITHVMHDVDEARRSLNQGPPQQLPGLVERPSRQKELSHGHRRRERVERGLAMPRGHAHEIEITAHPERPQQLHRRCRDAARNDVPRLFDRYCDAHARRLVSDIGS